MLRRTRAAPTGWHQRRVEERRSGVCSAVSVVSRTLRAAVALATLCLGLPSRAQSLSNRAFNVQLFEPSPSPGSLFTLDTPAVLPHLAFAVGLWGNYATSSLGFSVGGTDVTLVGDPVQLEAHAALGLFQYLELGIALPLVHQRTLDATAACVATPVRCPEASGHTALGDLRGYVKVPILRGRTSLSLRAGVAFPTGDDAHYAGARYWTLAPALVAAHTFGRFSLTGNLGARFGQASSSPFVAVNDELTLGLGARYDVSWRLGFMAEVIARVPLDAPPAGYLDGNRVTRVEDRVPAELFAGATVGITRALAATLGVGKGLGDGYGASGFRAFAGLRLTVERRPCAFGPEDFDGYQDDDFCGDPDNDGDGVVDDNDRCPNDREDDDGVLDQDGCPDPDNDGDGVLDDADRCPVEPEDHDRYQNDDGCPELDNDRDRIPDTADACPDEAEDGDNYQDEDGCPEPGPDAVVVTRTDSRLLVSQRVYFDYDSDTIKSVSFPLLDEVAATLRRNPDILRLRVEGHTDQAGTPDYNLDLSFRRARAVVEYLVAHGVAEERLEYQGYGQTRPTAAADAPGAADLNRRVEFTIVRQSAQPAPTSVAPALPDDTHHHRHHEHRSHHAP